jgi:hypothetical protein
LLDEPLEIRVGMSSCFLQAQLFDKLIKDKDTHTRREVTSRRITNTTAAQQQDTGRSAVESSSR